MLLRPCKTNCSRVLFKLNNNVEKFSAAKSIHTTCRLRLASLEVPRTYSLYRHSNIIGASLVRYASTNEVVTEKPTLLKEASSTEITNATSVVDTNTSIPTTNSTVSDIQLDEIPDIPTASAAVVEDIIEEVKQFHPNGELTFESIGLGGYSPVGIIQNCLEFLHIQLDLPWWTAIVIGTLCIRAFMFPLVIKSQINSTKMHNVAPQMQSIQQQLSEARRCGNTYEASLYATQLHKFMKKEGLSPWKSLLTIGVQAPVFISFFIGLRQMANVPVESLRSGGLWWFTDLTIPDPYYILPLITAATMYVTLDIGTQSLNSGEMKIVQYIFRAIPIFVFPLTINFPAVILCYWTTTNFVSLFQVGLLKIPAVRTFFNIPAMIQHKSPDSSTEKGGFITEVKESWTNMKIAKQLADRERVDLIQFEKAGRGPIKKTYKFDPTKQTTTESTVLAKKR